MISPFTQSWALINKKNIISSDNNLIEILIRYKKEIGPSRTPSLKVYTTFVPFWLFSIGITNIETSKSPPAKKKAAVQLPVD
jgi:hypothetical protein